MLVGPLLLLAALMAGEQQPQRTDAQRAEELAAKLGMDPAAVERTMDAVFAKLPDAAAVIDVYRRVCWAHPGDEAAARAAMAELGYVGDPTPSGWNMSKLQDEVFPPAIKVRRKGGQVECFVTARLREGQTAEETAALFQQAFSLPPLEFHSDAATGEIMAYRKTRRDGRRFEYALLLDTRKRYPQVVFRTAQHR